MTSDRQAGEKRVKTTDREGHAGGWGSLEGLSRIALAEQVNPVALGEELLRQNKPDGFICVSCAWSKPADPHPAEFCENGAKATAWDLTSRRCTPDFFAEHTVSDLLRWSDYDLEQAGRLTAPLRYDTATDRYVECGWAEAFAAIGRALKDLDPTKVVFYASGRASLEASYMYGLMARLYGSQNLPDSSNMCHESTSVGLKQCLGAPVGTVALEDFKATDGLFFFGQNVGSNSPRLLHDLKDAVGRGVPVVTFNPLREAGLVSFVDPQSPWQMIAGAPTPISSQYHQVKAGGDIAAMTGMAKWLIEADDAARINRGKRVLDNDFIAAKTRGFDAFAQFCRDTGWEAIELHSGLSRQAIGEAAATYAGAKAAIIVYGMGLTQHRYGVDNVWMVCNLLLLRGNVGRPGSGACPVRGHSNVQGQRTVGITEKPELAPLDRLAEQYAFEPPRRKGMNTVEVCEGVLNGEVQAFIGLGGNFLRAVPDTGRMEAAWPRQALTVQIATKLNRSHLVTGKIAYLLPCLSRIERDAVNDCDQVVAIEDSTSFIHASVGRRTPASEKLLSEASIIAGIAMATLRLNPRIDWSLWARDLGLVREAISATYPQTLANFAESYAAPGGFYRRNKARFRDFSDAEGGRANFKVPRALSATGFEDTDGRYRLMTLRSNDQFNTTIYGYDDRFRGITGTRDVVLMNAADMTANGLQEGDTIGLAADAADTIHRNVDGLSVRAYDIPAGCIAAYYPECNDIIAVGHHALDSKVPAAKSVPVRLILPNGGAAARAPEQNA